MADALNAVCYNYMAPMFVDTTEDRAAILRLRHIQVLQQLVRSASLAVVGVGEVSAECTLTKKGCAQSGGSGRPDAGRRGG